MAQTVLTTRALRARQRGLRIGTPEDGFDRVLTVALWLALVGVALQTVVHLANAATVANSQLNANADGNAMSWASASATWSAAFAATLHATLIRTRRPRFVLLACIFAFFSLDDTIRLHERLSKRVLDLVGLPVSWDSALWPALYLPLGGLTAVLLYGVARTAPVRARRFIAFGLGLLVTAVAAEAIFAPASTPETATGWVHTLEGAYEEGAELAGWILVAAGLTVVMLGEITRRLVHPLGRPEIVRAPTGPIENQSRVK